LVPQRLVLVLAHELRHAVTGADDPGYNMIRTDALINQADWITDGPAVRTQNAVARELGRANEVRVSFLGGFNGGEVGGNLVVGRTYTDNQRIDSVRVVSRETPALSGGYVIDERLHGTQRNLVIGSGTTDQVFGGAGTDFLYGMDGNDLIFGGDGQDRIYGGVGTDILWGEKGDDRIFGGIGNDFISGGLGNDLLHGGDRVVDGELHATLVDDGYDIVDYSIDPAEGDFGIRITVGTPLTGAAFAQYSGVADYGHAVFVRGRAVDTLISIEQIVGTNQNDTLAITSLDDGRIAGSFERGGLVRVDLGGGNDDILNLSGLLRAAEVNLDPSEAYVTALIGRSESIALSGVEHVIGSGFGDELRGNGTGIVLEGRGGSDAIHLYNGDIGIGGAGADTFYVYTDRLTPTEISGAGSYAGNVLILGFDRGDRLFVDGVEYNGYIETPNRVISTFSGGQFATFSSNTSGGLGIAPDLTGRLSLFLEGLRVDIAGFQPKDGNIDFNFSVEFALSYDRLTGEYNWGTVNATGLQAASYIYDARGEVPVSLPQIFGPMTYENWLPHIPNSIAAYDTLTALLG